MNNLPDFSNLSWFLIAALVVYIIVMGRYFLISGIFYLILYRWRKNHFISRKISAREYSKGQFLTEIIRSNITAMLFGISGAVLALLWQKGYTKIYLDVHDYSLFWLPLSLIIALLLQETYYYWLHRWMHIPSVYRLVHKWHHDSQVASPWTAFSFHPLEGSIQAIFLPLLLLFLPMHLYVLILMLVIMSFSSVINHLDIELYPKWFKRFAVTRWLIGATHHSLHHKQYKYNYGLYFTFWDKWSGTESPHFDDVFEQKAK